MTLYKILRITILICLSTLCAHYTFAMNPKKNTEEVAERKKRAEIIDTCNEHIDACRKRGEDFAKMLERIKALAAAAQDDIETAQ